MFNFYVILAGLDKITDTGMAIRWRRKFKAPSLKPKCRKKSRTFRKMGFNAKTNEDNNLDISKKPKNSETLKTSLAHGPHKQYEN